MNKDRLKQWKANTLPVESAEKLKALSEPSGSLYVFEDKDGRTIRLKGSMTIEDLVKHGVSKIGFVRPEKPLGANEWRHNGKTENVEVEHE